MALDQKAQKSCPDTGDRVAAKFAFPVLHIRCLDRVPSSFDAHIVTFGAVSVLRFMSGDVSDVNIVDPFFPGDIPCFF
jgi:hypothetical protein